MGEILEFIPDDFDLEEDPSGQSEVVKERHYLDKWGSQPTGRNYCATLGHNLKSKHDNISLLFRLRIRDPVSQPPQTIVEGRLRE